jgi:hypothetical protein
MFDMKIPGPVCLATVAIFGICSAAARDLTDKDFPKLAWSGKCTDSWKQPAAPGADVQSKLPLECEAITLTVNKGHSVLRFVTDHGDLAFISDTGLLDSKRMDARKNDMELTIDHAFALVTDEQIAEREAAGKQSMKYLVARGYCIFRPTAAHGHHLYLPTVSCFVPVVMGDEEYEGGLISSYSFTFQSVKEERLQ